MNTTRKVYKNSAQAESGSDEQGGGSLDEKPKSHRRRQETVHNLRCKRKRGSNPAGDDTSRGQQRDRL